MIAPPPFDEVQRSLEEVAACSDLVRVLPSIDINEGTVLLIVRRELLRRWHHEPRRLEAALSRAVGPVLWDQSAEALWVAIACSGYRLGKQARIPLSAWSSSDARTVSGRRSV